MRFFHPNDPDYIDNPLPIIEEAVGKASAQCEQMNEDIEAIRLYCNSKLESSNPEVAEIATLFHSFTSKLYEHLDVIEGALGDINYEL